MFAREVAVAVVAAAEQAQAVVVLAEVEQAEAAVVPAVELVQEAVVPPPAAGPAVVRRPSGAAARQAQSVLVLPSEAGPMVPAPAR
jgi:hypothetical protein